MSSAKGRKELEEALAKFFAEDGIAGVVCDWVLLVDYVPHANPDNTGFCIYYRDETIRWKNAFGLLKLWEMKLEAEYRGGEND